VLSSRDVAWQWHDSELNKSSADPKFDALTNTITLQARKLKTVRVDRYHKAERWQIALVRLALDEMDWTSGGRISPFTAHCLIWLRITAHRNIHTHVDVFSNRNKCKVKSLIVTSTTTQLCDCRVSECSKLRWWHLTAFTIRVLATLMVLWHQSTPLQLGPNGDLQTKVTWSFQAHLQLGSASAASPQRRQLCGTIYHRSWKAETSADSVSNKS